MQNITLNMQMSYFGTAQMLSMTHGLNVLSKTIQLGGWEWLEKSIEIHRIHRIHRIVCTSTKATSHHLEAISPFRM